MENKEVIYSYSRLQVFNECQHEYYLTYIKNLRSEGENIYGVLGTCLHELEEQLLRKEITNDDAVAKFEECVDDCHILGYEFITEKSGRNYVECITSYLKDWNPLTDKKYEIEKDFLIEIDGTKLRGFIDLFFENEDGTITIIDHKTSTKYSKKDIEKYAKQLYLYAYAVEEITGKKVSQIGWNFVKYVSKPWRKSYTLKERNEISDLDGIEYKRGIVTLDYDEESKNNLLNWIKETVAEINSKDIDNPYDWKPCSDYRQSFSCRNLCDHYKLGNCMYHFR